MKSSWLNRNSFPGLTERNLEWMTEDLHLSAFRGWFNYLWKVRDISVRWGNNRTCRVLVRMKSGKNVTEKVESFSQISDDVSVTRLGLDRCF